MVVKGSDGIETRRRDFPELIACDHDACTLTNTEAVIAEWENGIVLNGLQRRVLSVQDCPLILFSPARLSVVFKLYGSIGRTHAQKPVAVDNALVSFLIHHRVVVPELCNVVEEKSGQLFPLFIEQREPLRRILNRIPHPSKKLDLIVNDRYERTVVKIDEPVFVAIPGSDVHNAPHCVYSQTFVAKGNYFFS